MNNLTKKNLYEPEVYKECLDRINKLNSESKPQWGQMSAGQMMAHCAEVVEAINGKELKNTPFLVKLFKGIVRQMVVNDKSYPHSTKTHPQYIQKDPRDFEKEKQRLLIDLDQFVKMDKATAEQISHTLFGKMTYEERGWSVYKHLDHHLRQFGV